jgi:hypothetical protein
MKLAAAEQGIKSKRDSMLNTQVSLVYKKPRDIIINLYFPGEE